MNKSLGALALLAFFVHATIARADDDAAKGQQMVQRLSLCQDSWLEWKDNESKMRPFVDYIRGHFKPIKDSGGGFAPDAPIQVLGWKVTQVYPESVGMGVGFSVVVESGFEATRAAIEKKLGKKMKCDMDTSDGFKSCELPIADQKSVALLTPENGKARTSLVGCFYLYAK
jgi:hypothetical protein